MAKKNFEVNAQSIYDTLENATAPAEIPKSPGRAPATPEVAELAREQGKTQGRKGAKARRINMAFHPEVHEYIRTMARVRGETVTQFTNHVFRKSMEDNAEIYEQAKKFRERL